MPHSRFEFGEHNATLFLHLEGSLQTRPNIPGVLQGRDPVTNSGRLEGMMVAGVAGVAELRGGLLLTS